MDRLNFTVPSISCSVCSDKILTGIRELSGIEKTTVDLKTKNVYVEYNSGEIQPQEIKRKVASLGYEVSE